MPEHIIVSKPEEFIATVQLNRPAVLNALNAALMAELAAALQELDAQPDVRCIVLHGTARVFAAGADIAELAQAGAVDMMERDQYRRWERIRTVKTPVIAAVSGVALGGGCELAMCCDMIVASETARFSQPEINLGIMPGAGGTQRLTRAVGKALAMEMVLTGRMITADEALNAGLVNMVVPVEFYLDAAMKLARTVASRPPLAASLAKESVLRSFDLPLSHGLEFERKNYYLLYATQDKQEGMDAFIAKRKPQWKGK